MPGLFEHGHNLADRSPLAELDRGNNRLSDPMIEIFKKDKRSSFPFDRKRIRIEAMSGIGKDAPRRPRQVAALPDVFFGIPPSDMPMRRMAAKPVDLPRDRQREAPGDERSRLPRSACRGTRQGRQDPRRAG